MPDVEVDTQIGDLQNEVSSLRDEIDALERDYNARLDVLENQVEALVDRIREFDGSLGTM